MLDFVYNGQGYGDVASRLLAHNFDMRALRPYHADDDPYSPIAYVDRYRNGVAVAEPVFNAPATLRRNDWLLVDQAVVQAAVPRLRAFGDLRARGLEYNIPNGMGHISLGYEVMSDITGATISMDPSRISEFDAPQFDFRQQPLPVIHKDLQFTARQIAVSRQGGTPLDLAPAKLAARRVAEEVEKLTLGVSSSYTYAGGTVYGYTNFPNRITKSDITAPTTGGWTGATLVAEIIAMRELARAKFFYGPWMLYLSPAWAAYLDLDYSATKGSDTIRQRIANIEGIEEVRELEFLTGYQILLVQMQPDTAEAVVGMEIVTVRWEAQGGMVVNFKIMCIMVPRLRANYAGDAAIVHGTTS